MSTLLEPLAVPLTTLDPLDAAVPEVAVCRLTVAQYETMLSSGILHSGDPVELLDGWLVPKMTKNPPHTVCVGLLLDVLTSLIPTGWHVRCQEPITLGRSVPEPDLAIVRGSRRDYLDRHPVATDVTRLIEVADSTSGQDRGLKARLYAEAGISEYWSVDLTTDVVEVFSQPQPASPATYGQCQVYGRGQSIPFAIQGQPLATLAVDEILPGIEIPKDD